MNKRAAPLSQRLFFKVHTGWRGACCPVSSLHVHLQLIIIIFNHDCCCYSTQSASATVTPRAATSVEDCGSRQDGAVAACATTATTARRAVTARTARRASSETPAVLKRPPTPANVRPLNSSLFPLLSKLPLDKSQHSPIKKGSLWYFF